MSELTFIYDEFLINEDKKHLPRSTFSKDPEAIDADAQKALTLIKYVSEYYFGWSPETLKENISVDWINEMKLGECLQFLPPPEVYKSKSLQYIAEKIYPKLRPSFKEEAINTFVQVNKTKEARFPKGFFDGESGRIRAKFIMQKILNDESGTKDIKGFYELFGNMREANKLLRKNKMSLIIKHYHVFDSIMDYFEQSLPEELRSPIFHDYGNFYSCFKSTKIEIDREEKREKRKSNKNNNTAPELLN